MGSGLESLCVWGHTCWELGASAPGNGAPSRGCILDLVWMVSCGPGRRVCIPRGWTWQEIGSRGWQASRRGRGAHGSKRLLQVTSTAQLGDAKEMGQSPDTCSWQWPRHSAGVGVWWGLALAPCPLPFLPQQGAGAPDSAGQARWAASERVPASIPRELFRRWGLFVWP